MMHATPNHHGRFPSQKRNGLPQRSSAEEFPPSENFSSDSNSTRNRINRIWRAQHQQSIGERTHNAEMLRVSEFCRGPLSPVPTSGSRRRKRPSSERDKADRNGNSNIDRNDTGEVIYDDESEPGAWLPIGFDSKSTNDSCGKGEFDEENEEIAGCLVRLRPWNHALSTPSPVSSAVARIPLDVLKVLFLLDGDYAVLEKHLSVDAKTSKRAPSPSRANTLLRTMVVRLELMDEEEEGVDNNSSNNNNNICLTTPIVLANLGIAPQSLWQQKRSVNSFVLEEEGVTFRLRAIHDESEDSSDDDENDEEGVEASPWQIGNRENARSARTGPTTRRRRKRIAGRVLLRPLGRASQWPWFSLAPTTKAAQHQSPPSRDNEENRTIQHGKSTRHRRPKPEESQTNQTSAAAPNNKRKNEREEDDAWIYPSRSGAVLQESTLCEVRYKTKSKTGNPSKERSRQEQNVCYYEVLRIEEARDAAVILDEEECDSEVEDSEEDDHEIFYVTARCTEFELDSRPLSALSHVRRLPLPPPIAFEACDKSMTRDVRNHDKGTTPQGDDKCLEKSNSVLGEERSGPFVTPRKLFASSELSPERLSDISGQSHDRDATKDSISSDENAFSCHPDWQKVAQSLLEAPPYSMDHHDDREGNASLFGDAASLAASRILHLVGSDREHDIQACVNTAATMVGMQCLSINGLASFGYEHRRSQHNGDSPSEVTVRSAMIEQQLAGIDASLEHIAKRRMEPCVLHICDLDEELASVATDDQLRCQIEDRFWSKWTKGVAAVSTRTTYEEQWGNTSPRSQRRNLRRSYNFDDTEDDCYRPLDDRLDYRYTPRIIIVISTKSPLKKGAWLERLVFPSITLSLPHDRYIRYLWNTSGITRNEADGDDEILINTEEVNSLPLTEEMMPLLRGRPAQEIVQLKRQICSELCMRRKASDITSSTSNESEVDSPCDGTFQHLEKLCKDSDAGRRSASSDVARISNVSWEDVGGLDHVRAEILDAIELPLKHPHLFPPNTGRSGILLFGPPGTGKTLVAKAVANECGLPFLSVKGPELLGSYIGESEANIRKVFSSARMAAGNNRPVRASILFFDELDSLAPKRGGTNNHGGGVMERVVASLLAELDGGSSHNSDSGRVFVLGATNRPDLLDPSLLRPGRLDRLVYLGIPTDNQERTRVLASQLRTMKLEGDAVEMSRSIVEEYLPPRLTGADMSKLSNGAMLLAIRRLCRQADREREEVLKSQSSGEGDTTTRVVTIDEILDSWGEDKCTPIITLDDLRVASKDVTPSVSEEELQRYERLRAEHETSTNRTA